MKLALALSLLMTATVLAGCGSPGEPTDTATGTPTVTPTKGAITGLLIDDVFRPVPAALILVQEAGLTATTDATGVFGFGDLEPGRYTLKVQSDGHQAAAKFVDVKANQYTEIEIVADRLANTGSRIVTNQYSIFTPCAASTPVISTVHGYCFYDASGDSYRPGISDLNYTAYNSQNITYLVAEVVINQPDNYDFVVRHDNGEPAGGEEYGSVRLEKAAAGKIIIKLNDNYLKDIQPDNANWTNDKPLAAIAFYLGDGGQEVEDAACVAPVDVPGTPATNPRSTCRDYYGVGHKAAIEGNIILSLFLGEPEKPIETYCTITC